MSECGSWFWAGFYGTMGYAAVGFLSLGILLVCCAVGYGMMGLYVAIRRMVKP